MTRVIICILLILIFILIIVLLESKRELSTVKITNYDMKFSNLPKSFNGYKIAYLADLHGSKHDTRLLISKIKDFKPDIIIIGGDMIVSSDEDSNTNKRMANFLNELSDICHVYYGIGNHEKGMMYKSEHMDEFPDNTWKEYFDGFKCNDKITYMDNKIVEIQKNNSIIKLYGLSVDRFFYRRFHKIKLTNEQFLSYIKKPDENSFNILIAHHPDYFKDYSQYNFSLVLSGHNHGGLIRLPILGGVVSPRLHLFPVYDYGIFGNNNTRMILTSGLGSHFPKIRFNNFPEIVYITLNNE